MSDAYKIDERGDELKKNPSVSEIKNPLKNLCVCKKTSGFTRAFGLMRADIVKKLSIAGKLGKDMKLGTRRKRRR